MNAPRACIVYLPPVPILIAETGQTISNTICHIYDNDVITAKEFFVDPHNAWRYNFAL